MNCSSDCDRGTCPFVNDPNCTTRYVCLKCGLERDISDGIRFDPFFLLILVAPLVITMIMNYQSPTPQTDQTPTEFSSP